MATTVEEWLSLGLGKYVKVFAPNDVDLRALPHLAAADLQELGVSLGHRKIILNDNVALRGPGRGNRDPGTGPARARPRSAGRRERRPTDGREAPTGSSASYSVTWSLDGPVGSIEPGGHARLARRYQNSVAGAVTRFGGYVAQYLGDGVLAYFGWPWPTRIMPSVRSAPASRRSTRLHSLKTAAGEPLKARIGIATGHVVVGDFKGGGVHERGPIAATRPILLRGCRPLRIRARWSLLTARGASRANLSRSKLSASRS